MALTAGKVYIPESDIGGLGGVLKFSVASGAGSASDITVSGMEPEDTIAFVMEIDTGVPSDVTGNVTAIKEDAFQLSSISSGNTLFVCWLSRALPWA